MVYELKPENDGAKSFYGKAIVIVDNDGTKTLRSYTTDVAFIKDGVLMRAQGQPQSMTTSRHMREFALQNGFDRMSKAELNALPIR